MRILVIHTAFIGDIVLSTPLIQRLKDMYPNSKIDYLTLPSNKTILSNNPNLNEILIYDKKIKDRGIKGFLRVLKLLKEKKYDYAVIPHRFIRSIALARLAKIPKITGFDVSTGSWLLKEKKHYDIKKHEVERLLDLVEYKGPKIPIKIYPSLEDFNKIEKLLEKKKYEKLIVIAPGSQRPEKIWPIEKYKELIERLSENKKNLIAITGGNMEKHLSFRYQEIVADAGYESEENYLFLEKNGQSSFIKPMNYEISKTRKYKKDIGKMENMEYDPEKDSYRCQNRKMLTVQYQRKQKTATGYLRTVTVYQCHECKGCPFKEKCIKGNNCKTPMEKREKRLYVSKVMKQKREENVKRIISEYGNQLRMNRSIQAEGSFADVKEDMNFRRYLYRGKENVTAQSVILAIGYNINKLHHKIQNGRTGQHLFALKK